MYNQDESKMDDYDAFDYVNGDFDKVVKSSDDYDEDTNKEKEEGMNKKKKKGNKEKRESS